MKLAINYGLLTADLTTQGAVPVDVFKCPAWPTLIPQALQAGPTYVHLPLIVNGRHGDAWDSEKKRTADWYALETLLTQTDTPYINVHFLVSTADYPHLPPDTIHPSHIAEVVDGVSAEINAIGARFGRERVMMENVYDDYGQNMRLTCLPDVISQIVHNTGCGLLLDLAHAWLAAHYLGTDPRTYTAALPTAHIREMHIAGIQRLTEPWLALSRRELGDENSFTQHAGELMDHLPMRPLDWEFAAWGLGEVHAGRWARPWAVALEYGGVGPLWGAIATADSIQKHVIRLHSLLQTPQPTTQTHFSLA